ncbi:MAG: hypothetical protein ACR2M0_11020 [Chloroflexia bacterium]
MIFRHFISRRFLPALALAAMLVLPLAGTAPASAAPPAQTPLPTDRVPDPHLDGVLYFPQTGHTLRGTFRKFWENHGGLAQFGYPITEEFVEPGGPTLHLPPTVQFFQRNRFEHHTEYAGTDAEVLLGLLGVEFHTPDPPAPEQANPANHYFSQTGHNVGPIFYNYWNTHGGLAIHGYPISEAFNEVNPIDGKNYLVQYFQRSRYEYHPEMSPSSQVLLGLLGTQLAQKRGYFGSGGSGANVYPPFGHAADFSWISGQVTYTRIQGGCTFIRYGTANDELVQPDGPGWNPSADNAATANGAHVILFGHFNYPGQPSQVCPARAYWVDHIQLNNTP